VSLSLPKFKEYLKLGYIKFGGRNGGGRTPYYLMSGQIAAVENGDLVITGRDEDGAAIIESVVEQKQPSNY
jgi:adenine-specific DNA-methyltransferase